MADLLIQVDCGETTCASSTGAFCRYFSMRLDGAKPYCRLFRRSLKEDRPDGWVQRCLDCIQAENESRLKTPRTNPVQSPEENAK